MRKTYSSDISRKQFEKIKPLLESARKKTKPRTLDLYDVFCAALSLLKSGCQWRMLPGDFPKWRSVHEYFLQWRHKESEDKNSLLEEVLKKSVGEIRMKHGRSEKTSSSVTFFYEATWGSAILQSIMLLTNC